MAAIIKRGIVDMGDLQGKPKLGSWWVRGRRRR